ncbi:MAG: hypothetical protein LQ351_002248 [Letrouitia transgressa]|nr:MAG: hypothetical protein LQ351_002248 [Letrouitia transgressa]
MLRTSFRRSPRSRILRASFLTFLAVFLLDLLSIVSARRRHQGSAIPADLRQQEEKIFVSSIHWNNEAILRDSWNEAVIDLVNHFGPDRIYVSIFESGSWDDTKGALRLLDNELQSLGVPHSIVLEESTHADELARTPGPTGWIETPRGKKELRRVPYLSALRNISLKPLAKLAKEGIRFQRVLFLNDVVFSTEDIVKLLATRGGDFAAVCSLDFMRPPSFYDTFALRDSNGVEPISSTFPYFRSSSSRNAMVSGNPVPVQSCWNGIVPRTTVPSAHTKSTLEVATIPLTQVFIFSDHDTREQTSELLPTTLVEA